MSVFSLGTVQLEMTYGLGEHKDKPFEKLHEAFHGIDPRVINPGVWFNHT